MLDAVEAEFPDAHVVVIIDTIGRAVHGKENDNDTIMDFYRHAGAVLKAHGVTWVRLDHTGHEGEHARGGSAKADDVDVVWQHERTDAGCKLIAHKRRASMDPRGSQLRPSRGPGARLRAGARLLAGRNVRPGRRARPPGTWPLGATTREAQSALKAAGEGRARRAS